MEFEWNLNGIPMTSKSNSVKIELNIVYMGEVQI